MATNRPKLKFLRGSTYTFDVSAAALATHPFKFTADSGSTEYTTGVTLTGTQGQAGASLSITVSDSAPFNLNYFCGDHGLGKGNHIVIPAIPPDPFDSDGEFFSVHRSHIDVTAGAGTLYTGSSGNVYYMAVDEGVPASNDSDGTFLTDSDINVSIDSGEYLYGGGYGNVFQLTPVGESWYGDRALWITGNNEYNGPYTREIEYNDITTLGNSQDFANLAIQRAQYGDAAGSSTYYLVGGGRNSNSGSSLRIDNIDRGVVATLTDATDFGDLTQARNSNVALSNGVRALWGGGYTGSIYVDTIDYVTVDTPGNAQDFGDFNAGTSQLSTAGTADDTRGVFAGSIGSTQSNVIEYVTIATTGNAQDFGDLTHDGYGMSGVTDGTYGFFTGDGDNIERITIQTPGNATDFGSLTTASRRFLGAAANTTRAVQAGGSTSTDPGETMEYFTMATGNDAASFGNLSEAKTYVSGHSGNAA